MTSIINKVISLASLTVTVGLARISSMAVCGVAFLVNSIATLVFKLSGKCPHVRTFRLLMDIDSLASLRFSPAIL